MAVCGFLVVAVLITFGRTLSQGFLNYDDSAFVYNQPHVFNGLSWSGVVWAFTEGPFGEWYPLAVLSHMLDCDLYGLRPAGHHLTNVLLHAASTVTLFLVLWRMTGELWPSALVAALFALHPLHVESVAWVAERRDVLSGLFFMLTLGAYGEYVRHPRSLGRYLAVVASFGLGLMSKSILVTLPPLLLLLDFWPLERFGRAQAGTVAEPRPPATPLWRIVLEKLPLFALAIATAVATMKTHARWSDPLTPLERLANAVVSCVAYLGQVFVPVGISPFYAHPAAGRPAWQVAASLALLLAITAAAVIGRRSYPYLFVGWFWYLGMLAPVLGIISVAAHARADRYTYLSQIGIYIALTWGASRLGASWPARRWVFGIGSALALTALSVCTWHQIGYWQNDTALWEHALACDPTNATAHYNLGNVLHFTDEGAAVAQYQKALEMSPNDRNIHRTIRAMAESCLGDIAARKGDLAEAIAHYEQASKSDSALAHMRLGVLLANQGKVGEAKVHFKQSVELQPDDAGIYCEMANALAQQGRTDEAIANLRKALEIDPNLGVAHVDLAILLAERDDSIDEAIIHRRRAIEINPNGASSYYHLARLLRRQGKTSEATKWDERGRIAGRRDAKTRTLRGTELAEQGKTAEAIAEFQMAVAATPDYAQAHCKLGDALASLGKLDGARLHYRRALEIDPNLAAAKQGLERLSNR
jgi:tetratricopeptide (TPR) repeat protein